MCRVFFEECYVEFLMFSGGIGFSILVGDVFVGGGGLAIRVLWGICSTTGWWSEFRFRFVFVVEMNLL